MAENEDGPRCCPTLESLVAADTADLRQMYNAGDIEAVPENVGNEPESTLFNYLLERNQLFTATGFTEAEILSLHQLLQPYTVLGWQPGACPKSSWRDMLVGRYFDDVAFINDDVSTTPAENQ